MNRGAFAVPREGAAHLTAGGEQVSKPAAFLTRRSFFSAALAIAVAPAALLAPPREPPWPIDVGAPAFGAAMAESCREFSVREWTVVIDAEELRQRVQEACRQLEQELQLLVPPLTPDSLVRVKEQLKGLLP